MAMTPWHWDRDKTAYTVDVTIIHWQNSNNHRHYVPKDVVDLVKSCRVLIKLSMVREAEYST